ncbi:glycosyltransferase family 2 protein [Actibacterium ureilyticum]|uniref:glycosyltransferase family 2 protein n=1 Tax=Actibacterium ureilyticum TaxID=1590614 RepID=UPI001FE9CA42|nr:glycosyltransferase family 2 protein [Actibacterium ureilyticum]
MRSERLPSSGTTAGIAPEQVLVAVPALNEAGAIEACLQSLIGDDPWMGQVRVVVADGGSHDATRQIVTDLRARYPNLMLIDNPLRLQSAGINRVVDSASTPAHQILVRCDAHALYPPGYVQNVANALIARPDAASLATPMDARGAGCFQRAAAWVVDTPLGSGGSAHRGGQKSHWVDHGHHAGFRLDWYRRIGGYDESFSHNEDAEYDHRLGLAGGRVWLESDIRLDYTMRPTLRALARQYLNYGRGRARNVAKHRMRPRLRQLIPAINFAVLALAIPLALVWPWALVAPLGYIAVLALVSGLAVRRIGPCGLWAGPALAAMHNAWGFGFLQTMLKQMVTR